MSPAETTSRLRRLANDWRKEEKQLCEQFGNEIVPQSMRARMIRDTQAIDAAVEMIERFELAEKERDALQAKVEAMEKQEPVGKFIQHPSHGMWEQDGYSDNPDAKPLYLAPGAQTQGERK